MAAEMLAGRGLVTGRKERLAARPAWLPSHVNMAVPKFSYLKDISRDQLVDILESVSLDEHLLTFPVVCCRTEVGNDLCRILYS